MLKLNTKHIYFFTSQMRNMVSSAWNSGLGATWIGLTDIQEDGKVVYWSSGKPFGTDFTVTAWGNIYLDGSNGECVVIFDNDFYDDRACNETYYGLCVLESKIC